MSKICPHCHQEGTFEICAAPGFIIVVNQKGERKISHVDTGN